MISQFYFSCVKVSNVPDCCFVCKLGISSLAKPACVCFSAGTLSVLLSQLSDQVLIPAFVHSEESMDNFPL